MVETRTIAILGIALIALILAGQNGLFATLGDIQPYPVTGSMECERTISDAEKTEITYHSCSTGSDQVVGTQQIYFLADRESGELYREIVRREAEQFEGFTGLDCASDFYEPTVCFESKQEAENFRQAFDGSEAVTCSLSRFDDCSNNLYLVRGYSMPENVFASERSCSIDLTAEDANNNQFGKDLSGTVRIDINNNQGEISLGCVANPDESRVVRVVDGRIDIVTSSQDTGTDPGGDVITDPVQEELTFVERVQLFIQRIINSITGLV